MNIRTLITIIGLLYIATSCQLHKDLNVSQGFANKETLQGEWKVDSEILIAFEIFEDSEGESEIELAENGALLEKFEGYYHETPWTVETEYLVLEHDAVRITVKDSQKAEERVFSGSFRDGLVSALNADGSQKMEIDFSRKKFIRKIYHKIFNGEWELEQHWVYRPD